MLKGQVWKQRPALKYTLVFPAYFFLYAYTEVLCQYDVVSQGHVVLLIVHSPSQDRGKCAFQVLLVLLGGGGAGHA